MSPNEAPELASYSMKNVSAVSEAIRRTMDGLARQRVAGSLLIQPFEGSRFGTLGLWILDSDEGAWCEQ